MGSVATIEMLTCHSETQEATEALSDATADPADQHPGQLQQKQHGRQVLGRCSASLPDVKQLEQMHNHQSEQLALQDLPRPWQRAFISLHLNKAERLALFQVSRATAAMVVQNCCHLNLKPHQSLLRSSSRRSFVLDLAAGCRDIRLCVEISHVQRMRDENSISPLDSPALWPCIKQLELINVGLNSDTIASLNIGQLTELHSISFDSYRPDSGVSIDQLDTAAVQRLVQAGGLPALRQASFLYRAQHPEARPELRQLGAIMGHQVTKLSVGRVLMFEVVDSWPALQHVGCNQHRSQVSFQRGDTSVAVKQLFSHPNLKTVTTPSDLFEFSTAAVGSSRQLELLHLTDDWVSERQLMYVPTHAVQHLRLHSPVLYSMPSTAAVQHLRKCSKVEVMPIIWRHFWGRFSVGCVDDNTPTVETTWDPEWLNCLLPSSQLQGALLLNGDGYAVMEPVTMAKLASLALIPVGVHTLAFVQCRLAPDCTWVDVMAHIPGHIQVLVMRACGFCEADLQAVLGRAPPTGLKHWHLEQNQRLVSPVLCSAPEAHAAAAAKWPHVALTLRMT